MKGLTVKVGADTSQFTKGMDRMRSKTASVAASIKGSMSKVFKGAAAGGTVAAIGSIALAAKAVSEAADFEVLQVQMEGLLGSATKASARMATLADFAASTPFALTEITKASKVLETLTAGALSTGDGLRMVGDIAANTGQPFEELSVHVGRLYDGLQNGQAVGESLNRLNELGIISSSTKVKIAELQKEGKKGQEVWGVAAQAFTKFSGSMGMLSETFRGKFSTLKDNWASVLRAFGKPVMNALKPMLDGAIAFLPKVAKLAKSMGDSVAKAIGIVSNLFKSGDLMSTVSTALTLGFQKAINFLGKAIFATVATAGTFISNSLSSAAEVFKATLLSGSFWSALGSSFQILALEFIKAINASLPKAIQKSTQELTAIDGLIATEKFNVAGRGAMAAAEMIAAAKTIGGLQMDTAKEFGKNFGDQKDLVNTSGLEAKLSAAVKGATDKTKAEVEGDVVKTATNKDGSPITDSKFKVKSKKDRGQKISSLGSHGGGRGFVNVMGGLTKAALQGNKILSNIHRELKKPQGGLA